ncbi:MAG: hypothetical protein C0471_19110 [Erythrobacter sp.]|nr:hypothetical protein [Erythrobacter sp.]
MFQIRDSPVISNNDSRAHVRLPPNGHRFKKTALFHCNNWLLEMLPEAEVASPDIGINANLFD